MTSWNIESSFRNGFLRSIENAEHFVHVIADLLIVCIDVDSSPTTAHTLTPLSIRSNHDLVSQCLSYRQLSRSKSRKTRDAQYQCYSSQRSSNPSNQPSYLPEDSLSAHPEHRLNSILKQNSIVQHPSARSPACTCTTYRRHLHPHIAKARRAKRRNESITLAAEGSSLLPRRSIGLLCARSRERLPAMVCVSVWSRHLWPPRRGQRLDWRCSRTG